MRQHVVLVPGFFGFASIGDFAYFAHVRSALSDACVRRGLRGEIRVAEVPPTASLRKRAACVVETIADVLAREDGDVHLIGHSSGGLDARLALSPGAALPSRTDPESVAAKVRTIVSLSSPHYGSPLATFLTGLYGRELLRLISLATIVSLRTGRIPIAVLFQLVRLFGPARLPGDGGTLLAHLYQQLLADFSADRRKEVEEFMGEVEADRDLLQQIGPAGMDLFDATTRDRPGVRYGSVVTCAKPRGLRSVWNVGLSPYRQATHALYGSFHQITARVDREAPELRSGQAAALSRAFGGLPAWEDNDGMVPTRAQVWGEVVHATWGDHLDALGHFYLPEHVPPHFDWLNSGAGFSRSDFECTWGAVAAFLFDEHKI